MASVKITGTKKTKYMDSNIEIGYIDRFIIESKTIKAWLRYHALDTELTAYPFVEGTIYYNRIKDDITL